MSWRFVDAGAIEPCMGPALFEAVMDEVKRKESDDTILFWRPETPAVYVGFHQLIGEDVNAPECEKRNVPIIRRILGGGTGYCDSDQILYNVIYSEDRKEMPGGPAGVYGIVLSGLVSALGILGIGDARIEGDRFSVYANGKKISGSGQFSSGGVVNSGGSFLVGFDFDAMTPLLKNPVKNLSEGITKPEDGMTYLRRELGREVSMQEASSALRKGLEASLGKTVEGKLTEDEKNLASGLREKYLTREWTFRADIRKQKRIR